MVLFTVWPDDDFVWLHSGDISICKASPAIHERKEKKKKKPDCSSHLLLAEALKFGI